MLEIFKLSQYRFTSSVSFLPLITIETPVIPVKCSLPFLRQFAASHHEYPTIYFDTVNKPLTVEQLQQLSTSASCWFSSQFDKRNVFTAWSNKSIQRILVLGDSNGGRYFNAIIQFMQSAKWSCKIMKKEKLRAKTYPDASYFVREPFIKLKHIKIRFRDCASCLSTLEWCTIPNGKGGMKELWIEYIAVEFILDAEVTTHRTLWSHTCEHGQMCEHSTSTQEFIFKEYLHGQYPDVVFYFASCHDMVRHKLRYMRQNFGFLFELMDIYLPINTTAIFMNLHKQKLSLISSPWKEARYDDGKLNCNDAAVVQNKIMYESLEKYLLSRDRLWYAFPSLFDNTNATDHLYEDNIHRTDDWYDYIVRNLMYLLST